MLPILGCYLQGNYLSLWGGTVFEVKQCFGLRICPHAVMVTLRKGSWQDGSKTARTALCLFCRCSSPKVVKTKWCIPRGYHISEQKQADESQANRIPHWKTFHLQRLYSWWPVFFQEKSIFGNVILVFSFWYLGGKMKAYLFLHSVKHENNQHKGKWGAAIFTVNIQKLKDCPLQLCVQIYFAMFLWWGMWVIKFQPHQQAITNAVLWKIKGHCCWHWYKRQHFL